MEPWETEEALALRTFFTRLPELDLPLAILFVLGVVGWWLVGKPSAARESCCCCFVVG